MSFDDVVLPHLPAGHRLARWLMGNDDDAEDVVQEASLRALRYFRTFTGGNGRAWFLRIVRNTCWERRGQQSQERTDLFDEEQHTSDVAVEDPETLLLRTDRRTLLARALSDLPDRFRGLLVLRELQGLSYREVADAMGMPIGTVMSGLSRARQALRVALGNVNLPNTKTEKESTDAAVHGHSRAYRGFDGRRVREGAPGRSGDAGKVQRQVPALLVRRRNG